MIEAETLTNFEVSRDGARVRFNAEDAVGTAVTLSFPTDCLRQMVMTLPRIAQEALRLRHGDDSLRVVFPAGAYRIERGEAATETFIVTLATSDGFEVSFGFDPAELRAMGLRMQEASALISPSPILN